MTRRDAGYGNVLPDTIHIYQGPIEEDCADEEEMAELVRDVVIHEVGHYFGLDDETMDGIEHERADAASRQPRWPSDVPSEQPHGVLAIRIPRWSKVFLDTGFICSYGFSVR